VEEFKPGEFCQFLPDAHLPDRRWSKYDDKLHLEELGHKGTKTQYFFHLSCAFCGYPLRLAIT
jgi:hypothetical protein